MKTIINHYKASFEGLSKEIWYLSLITLINRAGTMVIPFLSLYLTKSLDFSKDDAGWILACFGIGSVIGGWLGGKLTDKIGYYKVMIISLFITGINFIILQYITSFIGLCLAILFLMIIADSFRPAVYVSIKAYSKPKNQTRSLALLRLAINIGMGIGPTIAGLIIVMEGYDLLFWIDGLTCIFAVLLFKYLVKSPEKVIQETKADDTKKDLNIVYKDFTYWIFIAICFFMGMAFMQLIVTMPVYYNEIFGLDEFKISLILVINIVIIILFEMPLISFLEKTNISITTYILTASLLMSLSFLVLYENYWIGILILSMIIITLGEMLGFPYTNKFALSRTKEGVEGSYMALYAIAFSLSHIFSPKIGLNIVENYGYQVNWLLTCAYGIIGVILSLWLQKRIKSNPK
ncbi:MFS transporter [uncultured Psychroserpens sp.]|uniref:MDR family MFS transporter n=1 Tax=uncultured Psychroserpens sp. TaxID=255436 RepID=UPI002634D054|nr:MFS transporter [uncultured Psychroserpens sp.]